MNRVFSVVGADDAMASLPEAIEYKYLDLKAVDLYICALGSEDRTIAGLAQLRADQVMVTSAIVWEYSSQPDMNAAHHDAGVRLLEEIGASTQFVSTIESIRPTLEAARENLQGRQSTIVLDISVMSGKLVLAWIDALSRLSDLHGLRLVVTYAEAEEYLPTENSYRAEPDAFKVSGSLGLEDGVLNVSAASNFEGAHDPQLRDLVLVIPGFSRDRTRAGISYINPALLLSPEGHVRWAVSVPHLPRDRWRYEAMEDIYDLNEESQRVDLPTFDYRATYRYLEEQQDAEWLRSNLNVVFLGSKFQALGLGLFCSVRRSTRVVIAVPERYRLFDYTRGVRSLWCVDFTDWRTTMSTLGSVGTIRLGD